MDVVYVITEDNFLGLGITCGVSWQGVRGLFTPGMWIILKWYHRVFSFRFLSLVLLMLSSNLSLNILRSGWWSTATIRLVHLKTKCLALSRELATAIVSPSIGAYLDSATCVNILPTRWSHSLVYSRIGHWRDMSSCSGLIVVLN